MAREDPEFRRFGRELGRGLAIIAAVVLMALLVGGMILMLIMA